MGVVAAIPADLVEIHALRHGEQAHRDVRAASGVCVWQDRLAVVQDDVDAIALIDLSTHNFESIAFRSRPESAPGAAHEKATKLDLEACTALPDGRMIAFASGSTPDRERLVVVDRERRVRVIAASELYENIKHFGDNALSSLNIEGVVVSDERLVIFHRGNGAADVVGPATVTFALASVVRWIDGMGAPPSPIAVERVDLGRVGGVRLGFADATTLNDGRVVFLAGAEDSATAYDDGEVLGTWVGVLQDNNVQIAPIHDARGRAMSLKLEGIAALGPAADKRERFAVVADMDDPNVASMLGVLVWAVPPKASAK